MIVAKTLGRLREQHGSDPYWWPPGDVRGELAFDAIADSVKALVQAGRLEAQGNLSRPRRSEVRLANPGGTDGIQS